MRDPDMGPVERERDLIHRIETFLDNSDRGSEIREFSDRLLQIGEVAVFGGMVRDFARVGAQGFHSDVDLVIDAEPDHLAKFMYAFDARRNKFGGYRVTGRHIDFDVWALSDTWAARQGHVKASVLSDLLLTTFFDWDSAVYLLKSREMILGVQYIEKLQNRLIEVNLVHNPNVLGAIVRTIRAMTGWKGSLGPKLTEFLLQGLSNHRHQDIEQAQRAAFNKVWLPSDMLPALQSQMLTKNDYRQAFRYEHAISA